MWRVGNKIKLNVYKDDRPVCQCHNATDALDIVETMERIECQEAQREVIVKLKTALTSIRTMKERIPFDAADAATECVRVAKEALAELNR